jgi:amino acid adenylation domain-containing protein
MFIHEIFEAMVRKAPEDVALRFEGGTLSYRALNDRANRLARYLRNLGVGPESVVGIYLERCPDLVVSLFGVLKAGGACLPLDPAHPPGRIESMLDGTRARIVITREPELARLSLVGRTAPPGAGAGPSSRLAGRRTVLLDRESPLIGEESPEDPRYAVLSANLALVFYTSGSTGSPKAVMWEHGRREVYSNWEADTFRLTEQDRHLLKAPIGFTMLAAEVFAPLLSGGELVVVPAGLEQDTGHLVDSIQRHLISCLIAVPSMLRTLVEHDRFPDCTSLRVVRTIGEALTGELRERFHCRCAATLIVMYGATEAPGAAYSRCERAGSTATRRLGIPLPGKEIHLLDNHLDPVRPGESGEICIGGALARGYMGRPDLTAERFVPDPFSAAPGARLYRTGDYARLLPDGAVEFVGRIDHQLKIRGYRVEPTEIESAICEYPGVWQAAVTARADAAGDLRLVAYLATAGDDAAPIAGLRRFLEGRLPAHMIPGVFVKLVAMPLSGNGKIDRGALPDPGAARPESDTPFVPASTPVEVELAAIWASVLEVERVGTHDNFFDLGGHSLSAFRLVSRVVQSFGLDLPLKTLFDAPTIAAMAKVIEATRGRPVAERGLRRSRHAPGTAPDGPGTKGRAGRG